MIHMKDDESFGTIHSVISVLGEIQLLETYFNGFDKSLSILLADKEINNILNPDKIFNLHGDIESIKSDIHSVTKKLLTIAEHISQKQPQSLLEEKILPTQVKVKIRKKSIDMPQQKNEWVENVSKYFYGRYQNNTDEHEDGEEV